MLYLGSGISKPRFELELDLDCLLNRFFFWVNSKYIYVSKSCKNPNFQVNK